jgi:hypothetical protein
MAGLFVCLRREERRRVHTDMQAFLNAGVIDRKEDGKVEFPYDAAHDCVICDAS